MWVAMQVQSWQTQPGMASQPTGTVPCNACGGAGFGSKGGHWVRAGEGGTSLFYDLWCHPVGGANQRVLTGVHQVEDLPRAAKVRLNPGGG